MIYNWDEEHIDLFIGTGKKLKPYTEQELIEIAEREAKDREAENNMEKLIKQIKVFGWEVKANFDTVNICLEPKYDSKFSKDIFIRVQQENFESIINSLFQINEFIKNNPINDRDPRYKMDESTIKRFVTAYRLKIDDKKVKSIEKERVYRNFSIYDIKDHNSEFSTLLKIEKPELYSYLIKNEYNLWQLQTAATKKERQKT